MFPPACFDAKIHDFGEKSSFFRRQSITDGLTCVWLIVKLTSRYGLNISHDDV